MKSLYDKNHRYTPEADELANVVGGEVFREMSRFYAMGYSPREISKILQDEIKTIELEMILNWKDETE